MEKVIHRATDRGHGEYDWLVTNYSFSFADWYNPKKMGFGALRVLNDDIIAPANGFGAHSHNNMEIITIVLEGEVTHKDSMGNTGKVPAGDVQIMSAGTGIIHSEYNDSKDKTLELFQLWIEPKTKNNKPRYEQKSFTFSSLQNNLLILVNPEGKEGLKIDQDAYVTYGDLTDTSLVYTLNNKEHGVYILIIEGDVQIDDKTLFKRDAIGLTHISSVTLEPINPSKVLIIEVPMNL